MRLGGTYLYDSESLGPSFVNPRGTCVACIGNSPIHGLAAVEMTRSFVYGRDGVRAQMTKLFS